MDDTQIYAVLTEVFADIFDEEVALAANLTARDVPGWDSFTHINIIVATEGRFGVKFTSAEVESFKNVGDFVETIRRKTRR